jgi:hypothetical protein
MFHIFKWNREDNNDKTRPNSLARQRYKIQHARRHVRQSLHNIFHTKRQWPSSEIVKYQVINYL